MWLHSIKIFPGIFALMSLVAGLGIPIEAGADTEKAIWERGRVSLPVSMIRAGECRSGIIRNLEPVCSAQKVPAVIFIHGCSGLNFRQFDHMDMFSKLGYPVFAPSSFARPGREKSCGKADSVMDWRLEEIKIAIENVRKMSWIDQSKLILAGFSEGGIATAEYGGNEFIAHIGMGFGCDRRQFSVSNDTPVLQINGKDDQEVSEIELCTQGSRKKFKAIYVDTGHPVDKDPVTIKTIGEFLDDVLGKS
ncbi:MAG: dienelactone hydrolase family protein [Rhodospirillales bacterium]